SPCRGIRLSSQRQEEPRFLSVDELARLADEIGDDYRAMVLLAGAVGLRFGECAGLRVGRIDWMRRTVTIAETVNTVEGQLIIGDPKTKMSRRTVALPEVVVTELAAHVERRSPIEPDDLVFTGAMGGPLRRGHFRQRIWLPAVARAGFEELTFHGLRHSAAYIGEDVTSKSSEGRPLHNLVGQLLLASRLHVFPVLSFSKDR
ncbi:MAG: site-specific integrase, partial [Phycisphaeraceae bacterium]|nr:site-specific integrase [Phycisphaeraceae bacterium]